MILGILFTSKRNIESEDNSIAFTMNNNVSNSNDLKALNTFANCQRQVFSLGVSQHIYSLNNKPVQIWTQLVIEVARKLLKKQTPLLYKIVCFQIGIKGFWPEVFCYFSEKLPLS